MIESKKVRGISQGESPEGNGILIEREKKKSPMLSLRGKCSICSKHKTVIKYDILMQHSLRIFTCEITSFEWFIKGTWYEKEHG